MENLYSDTNLDLYEWTMYMSLDLLSNITLIENAGLFNTSRKYSSIVELINTGFSWAESPQGGHFWANLESEISRRPRIQIGKKVSIIEEDGEY